MPSLSHYMLRCALAVSPTSADVEHLLSLLSRINWVDCKSLDMLEKLLLLARDSLLFTVYDYDLVLDKCTPWEEEAGPWPAKVRGQTRGSVGVLSVAQPMMMLLFNLTTVPFLKVVLRVCRALA